MIIDTRVPPAMNNDDFRSLLGLSSNVSTHNGDVPEPLPSLSETRTSWPELVKYDGHMVIRAIQHDRPDVRVITVQEDELSKQFGHDIDEQYALSEREWEALAAPLTDDERRAMELVVVLCVRACRTGRSQDSVVVETPFVMRRPIGNSNCS